MMEFIIKNRFDQMLITTHKEAKYKRCFLSITEDIGLAPEDGTATFFEATCDCYIFLHDGYITGELPLTTIPGVGMSCLRQCSKTSRVT